jgi:hypothetical protein
LQEIGGSGPYRNIGIRQADHRLVGHCHALPLPLEGCLRQHKVPFGLAINFRVSLSLILAVGESQDLKTGKG